MTTSAHTKVFALAANVLSVACTVVRPAGSVSELTAEEAIPPLTCDVGLPSAFTLRPAPFKPDPKLVKFENTDVTFELVPQVGGNPPYIRLDTCVDDETVTLARVVYNLSGFADRTVIKVPAGASGVTGLERAIFDEDDGPVDIRLPNPESEGTYLFIKGFRAEDGNSFATAFEGQLLPGDKISSNSIQLLAGKIAAGDPLAELKCPSGKFFRATNFKLKTASFDLELCEGMGGGETTSYDVINLVVTDTNSKLPPAEQAPKVFDTPEKVKTVMRYKWNHHNACDSFVLKLPMATYAATSSPAAGCGKALDGAPQRKFQTDKDPGVTLFTMKYGASAAEPGKLKCGHYLFFCRDDGMGKVDPTFSWHYTNHQWNTVESQWGDNRITITTPEGDDNDPKRNMSFGYRPKVIYNKATIGMQGAFTNYSRWEKDSEGKGRYIFCKRVDELAKELGGAFPLSQSNLAKGFALPEPAADNVCQDFSIPEPDPRPGFTPGSTEHTGDLVCVMAPNTAVGSGPGWIVLWVPMEYSAEPVSPFLNEKPKPEAVQCVDGQKTKLQYKK